MKKISVFALIMAAFVGVADAKYYDGTFRREVRDGLDILGVRETAKTRPVDAPGELGAEVYETVGAVKNDNIKMFIPTDMYVRFGGGLALPFMSEQARFNGHKHMLDSAYSMQIGLGLNLSSYVRTEFDAQISEYEFKNVPDLYASYQQVGAMLYFDFARRYVMRGDITRRRTFVPFMGLGAGFGNYDFDGDDGAGGFVIAAPRAVFGFNIMLTDVIGIDIAYQYQMMCGNGFGWNVARGGTDDISNIMVSLRANF